MARIGFIGLGKMGAGIASCLLSAGHDVQVYNRTASKADPLVKQGASLASSPAKAAVNADFIITMLSDDRASEAVWLGDEGVLSAPLKDNAIIIECSTLSYSCVQQLSAYITQSGYGYLDCPVTGLPDVAAAGELTLFVGGDAMALAQQAKLDLSLVAEALSRGAAASPNVIRTSQQIIEGCDNSNIPFNSTLRLKDSRYGLDLAKHFNQQMPVGTVATDAFEAIVAEGHGDKVEAKVIELFKKNEL